MTTTIKSSGGKTLEISKFSTGLFGTEVALKPISWGARNPDGLPDALFKPEHLIGALKTEGFLNGEFITDLPEVTVKKALHNGPRMVLEADGSAYYEDKSPEEVLTHAKELLAIHKVLVERQAEKVKAEAQRIKEAELAAEAAKLAEDARNKRRDELANELWGYGAFYRNRTSYAQKAIDRIIELETAQA